MPGIESNSGPSSTVASRREVFAWSMYDWANSAYSTLMITILMLYLRGELFPGDEGDLIYGWGIGLTMVRN